MAVENVTPPDPRPPLTDPLVDLMNRTLAGNLPYASHGAGYMFAPDVPLGQIYMPGPNATLFGSNPFSMSPTGVGYFGGSYNDAHGGAARQQQANQPIPYYPNNPQHFFSGGQQASQVPQGPSFGQGGFPYTDFAAFQQMMGGGGTGSYYMGSYGNPYGMNYQVNPWQGYGGNSVFAPGAAQQQYAAPPPPAQNQNQQQQGPQWQTQTTPSGNFNYHDTSPYAAFQNQINTGAYANLTPEQRQYLTGQYVTSTMAGPNGYMGTAYHVPNPVNAIPGANPYNPAGAQVRNPYTPATWSLQPQAGQVSNPFSLASSFYGKG